MKLAPTCSFMLYEAPEQVASKCVEPEKMKSEFEKYQILFIYDFSRKNCEFLGRCDGTMRFRFLEGLTLTLSRVSRLCRVWLRSTVSHSG